MNIYRIMLVDDEAEVRRGIAEKIDWLGEGFELVGEAENGQDALEKLEYLAPDVVFTDISMPYMNGLELAQQLQRFYPSVKVVLFSGHDEFEYAKQAIALNVAEYILKPINREELVEVLKKLYKALQDEVQKRRNIQGLRQSFEKNLPILREKFLDDLLHGRVNPAMAVAKMREYHLDLASENGWAVFRTDIKIPVSAQADEIMLHSEAELIPISVKQLTEEKLSKLCRFANFQFAEGLCCIAALNESFGMQQLADFLDDICKTAKKQLDLDVTIGLGRKCEKTEDIPRAYSESKAALAYCGIAGTGKVIYINEVEPVKAAAVDFEGADGRDLLDAVKFGTEKQLTEQINKIISLLNTFAMHQTQYQIWVMQIFCAIQKLCAKYNISDDTVFGSSPDYFEMLGGLKTTKEFERWLSSAAHKLRCLLSSQRQNAAAGIVQQAKDYINENYSDSELSLEDICTRLHVSTTYFSALFKKETGSSYISYLTDIRMRRAAELLRTTDWKTYIIAEKVGYAEPNYFGYVFKKQFGMSPAKYRGGA